MFHICKKRSKLELVACFAAGAMMGAVGCVMLNTKPMRKMKKKACRAAHCMTDFVVDNVKGLM